jgi:thioredoxin reductase
VILTTVAFIVLTTIFVLLHLRRTNAGSGRARDGSAEPRCPRCGAAIRRAAYCPGCGLSRQIVEIAAAPEANDAADAAADGAGTGAAGRPHAIVRADVCVGCGLCVSVCPEPGAIRLEGKLAVVDSARCAGHAACVAACPVGGIFVTTGDAVQRLEVPLVDTSFQSNVPGVFIVGELGGRGLIKNAVNEGNIAVEAIARALPPGGSREAGARDDAVDVAIVGAGPAGLSAGLEALSRGLRYALLEQGSVADSIRKYPRHKLLLAEPVKIPLYGDLWIADASKETLLEVWETIIARAGLRIETGFHVEGVARDGGRFVVRGSGRRVHAHHVVLAMGRRGTPRRLGVPGEDLESVLYDIIEMEQFGGRRVLVVGGGDSAIESALGLANQPGTSVTLSYRGDAFTKVKERNVAKIERAIAEGRVRPLLRSEVRRIECGRVEIEVDGRTESLAADNVIIRIGGVAPVAFLEKLGVRIVKKDIRAAEPEGAAVE